MEKKHPLPPFTLETALEKNSNGRRCLEQSGS